MRQISEPRVNKERIWSGWGDRRNSTMRGEKTGSWDSVGWT